MNVGHRQRWATQSLIWQEWNSEPVIYNVASGNTHLITLAAAKVLRQLEREPSTTSQIAERIALESDIDTGDPELREHVERLINDLDELGLVQRVTE